MSGHSANTGAPAKSGKVSMKWAWIGGSIAGIFFLLVLIFFSLGGGHHESQPAQQPTAAASASATTATAAVTPTYQPAFAPCVSASETVKSTCIFNSDGSSGFNTEVAGDPICTNLPAGTDQLFFIQDLEGGAWKTAATTNASMSADDVNSLQAASKPVGAFRFVGTQGHTPVTVQYWAVKAGQPCGAGPTDS